MYTCLQFIHCAFVVIGHFNNFDLCFHFSLGTEFYSMGKKTFFLNMDYQLTYSSKQYVTKLNRILHCYIAVYILSCRCMKYSGALLTYVA